MRLMTTNFGALNLWIKEIRPMSIRFTESEFKRTESYSCFFVVSKSENFHFCQ